MTQAELKRGFPNAGAAFWAEAEREGWTFEQCQEEYIKRLEGKLAVQRRNMAGEAAGDQPADFIEYAKALGEREGLSLDEAKERAARARPDLYAAWVETQKARPHALP